MKIRFKKNKIQKKMKTEEKKIKFVDFIYSQLNVMSLIILSSNKCDVVDIKN